MRPFHILIVFLVASGKIYAEPLETMVNFHAVNNELLTAGQVKSEHIPQLKQDAVELVVNLATASEEHNGKEGFLLAEQGISYVNIPVQWDNPKHSELKLFFAIMDARADRKTLVHCFANYRASAFTYLYRVNQQGVKESEARADLEIVWTEEAFEQYPQWRAFIDEALANHADPT